MAIADIAYDVLPPKPPGGSMESEKEPRWLWGLGTPDGDQDIWTKANKGTFYSDVNATDDDSHVYMKVDEGGDDADWVKLMVTPQTVAQTFVDTELHGWELNYTGTNISAANLVALNVKFTSAGTAGGWNSAIFANFTQGSAKNVNGYFCAAEFEATNSADNVSDWFVVVLNAVNNGSQQGSHSSYLALRDYGSLDIASLFWFGDHSIGSNDHNVLLSTTGGDLACDNTIRVIIGSTPYWIMLTADHA